MPLTAAPLTRFARELRDEGIPLGPGVATELLDVLELVDVANAEDVYWGMRAVTVRQLEHVPIFDRVFVRFFGRDAEGTLMAFSPAEAREWRIEAEDGAGEGDGDAVDVSITVGASNVERLAGKDFSELTPEEEQRIRTMIAEMVWAPGIAVSRRRRPARSGDVPDMRRTLRSAVGAESEVLRIATTRRQLRRRPVIFIADVSGSMEQYSEMLLYFAHAARNRLGRLEAFVFSTRITRITRDLERRSPSEAIARVSESVHDWSGGTRIGDAIAAFNRDWSRRVCRGGPIVIIVSDGWDRGEPEVLSASMDRLARSVNRVIWVNPLAGREGYRPETRGMQAALPHVDDFLPGGNFNDLRTLVGLLESVPAR